MAVHIYGNYFCMRTSPQHSQVIRLLLEWILQNMVRHFVTHKQVQAHKGHPI